MSFLREQLPARDPEVGKIAAWVLGRIGDQRELVQLRKNSTAAPDPLTLAYNEHSLAALGDADGLQALARNLADKDPAIRTYAATFAGDARALGVREKLVELHADDNVDVGVRAAQSLLVLSQPAAADPQEDLSQVVYPATKEHPRYTEGSILELADGSLLYAATEFAGSGSDFSKAHIVGRRSVDGGRSWQAPRVLQPRTGEMNVMSVTLRRLAAPAPEGTIAMFYLEKNAFDDLRVYVRFSQDEARTFGSATRVTPDPGYHVLNNDRVTQLASGRLLVPVASTPDVRKVS
jgi:sialidase-1